MTKHSPHKARLADIERKLTQAREAMSRTKIGEGSIHQLEEDIRRLEDDRDALIADQEG